MSLLTAPIVSRILAGIYLIFLKNVLDQTWKSFKIEFGPKQKILEKELSSKNKFNTFLQLSCSNIRLLLC